MTHDELNRLRYVIYPGGKRIDYTYDEAGNLHTIATSFGLVSYDYDAYNRLSRITLPNLNVIDYHYDENNYKGNLTSIHYPNGTYTTFDYDNRNRMTGLTNNRPGGIISQYAYTLDGVGNRTNVSFQEPLSWTPSLVGVDYSYLPGNFLTSAGATTYSYDPNGNLYTRVQGGNTTTYSFDSQDRLTGLSSPSLNIQYQYDGLFNRISKTESGTTTKYLVDPNGSLPQVIAEMDNGGNITTYYIYDGIGLVAKMTSSGNTYFYHYNGSGNTIALTDSSGNMVNKYAYDEFGNLVNVQESVANPFLFVGHYGVMDDDNGLLYMRARYYDPQVGRFINKDPIGLRGGINLFAYVENSPISYIDPWGLVRIKIGGKIYEYRLTDHHGVNPPEVHVHDLETGEKVGAETGKIYDAKGKQVCGKLSPKALSRLQKVLRGLGYLGIALAAYQTYETITADDAQALENLLNLLSLMPRDRREKMLQEIIRNNPDKFIEIMEEERNK